MTLLKHHVVFLLYFAIFSLSPSSEVRHATSPHPVAQTHSSINWRHQKQPKSCLGGLNQSENNTRMYIIIFCP